MRQYHSFNRVLANIFLKTAENYQVGEPFRLRDFLTHVEICNFQKLQYWNLAEKYENTLGEHIAGKWLLTIRALKLIRGEERVENYVYTFNNKVVERSCELVSLSEVTGGYKMPKDYAIEQTPAFESKDRQ